MCASVYSSLLLFIFATLTISIMCGTKMVAEGLPIRQERGTDQDILAGADFLSVFMESSLRHAYRERTTPTSVSSVEISTVPTLMEIESTVPYLRSSRDASYEEFNAQTNAEEQTKLYDTTKYSDEIPKLNEISGEEPSDNLDDGVIVAVRVSSSVGRTLINKEAQAPLTQDVIEDTTIRETTTASYEDQSLVASEEHPSLVAEANKSEFNVEEAKPIIRNTNLGASDFSSFPARVQAVPRPHSSQFNPSPRFEEQKLPYHQSVVYHNNPRESGRARSVSYSTVIQAVPHSHTEKSWASEKQNEHERHERHYDTLQHSYRNNFEAPEQKEKVNISTKTFQPDSVAESNNYFVTTKPLVDNTPRNWEKPEQVYVESSTRKTVITTERNWEVQEKNYQPPPPPAIHQHLPKVYGQPEQNYEIDEAVSVVSNGRAHGVQPSQSPIIKEGDGKKTDDNQKVGYVVEGRNYRKYRVEERTADGFIVGEYGVVSHDDGSLRGVRYTADGTISPRLIYDALMKFLSL